MDITNNEESGLFKTAEQKVFTDGKELKCDDNMLDFLQLMENERIKAFLNFDSCCRLADKYLIALAFIYFKKANFTLEEYTPFNFFGALHLAHDLEEDEEELKYEIHVWALGAKWQTEYPHLLRSRDALWFRMKCRAYVGCKSCEEVMAQYPDHVVWQRNRPLSHAGMRREPCACQDFIDKHRIG